MINRDDYKVGMFISFINDDFIPDIIYGNKVFIIKEIVDFHNNPSRFLIKLEGAAAKFGFDPAYFGKPFYGDKNTVEVLYGKED